MVVNVKLLAETFNRQGAASIDENNNHVKLGGKSSISSMSNRAPLQARSVNVIGNSTSAQSLSTIGGMPMKKLPSIEKSNSVKNVRIENRAFASSKQSQSETPASSEDEKEDAESSTIAEVGQNFPTTLSSAQSGKVESISEEVESKSVPPKRPEKHHRATASKSSSTAKTSSSKSSSSDDFETITIEEQRRNPNGSGHTTHRYLRGRLLGKGGFAKVYLCTALDTNKNYAVKVVPKANLVKTRARQKLIQAIRYMHENNVIHRDLKLGNLFLDKLVNIKVGDLGLATRLETSDEKRKTICGTPNYIAPEVIEGDKEKRGHSFEVDIWSMGVIIFTCLVGKPPYESKDVKATYQRILANDYKFPSEVQISHQAKDLISSMLQTNPGKRPTLDEITVHPFFTKSGMKLPKHLPSSVTHVAPVWVTDEDGNLVATKQSDDDLAIAPHTSKSNPSLRVLGAKDPNTRSEKPNNIEKFQSGRSQGGRSGNYPSSERSRPEKAEHQIQVSKVPSQKFEIFDEHDEHKNTRRPTRADLSEKDPAHELMTKIAGWHLGGKNADNTEHSDATSNRKEAATADYQSSSNPPRAPRSSAQIPPTLVNEKGMGGGEDQMVLKDMHMRLKNGLEEGKRSTAAKGNISPVKETIGTTWVARYVDYTSKYGLGFLLSDGSSGVYFNDSTKAVIGQKGKSFQYVERRKAATSANTETNNEQARYHEYFCETHTLDSYPGSLQKKVTLMSHFRNYLVEQQKRADDSEIGADVLGIAGLSIDLGDDDEEGDASTLVHLKKWVRTKHAILFRLSDNTVQVVFYDHTEVILTPDLRHVTYVDKMKGRNAYNLDDALAGDNAELTKRLKYARDIVHQLIVGSKR
eukprot:scaffold18143_cov49-Attheya_sp.AAC.2